MRVRFAVALVCAVALLHFIPAACANAAAARGSLNANGRIEPLTFHGLSAPVTLSAARLQSRNDAAGLQARAGFRRERRGALQSIRSRPFVPSAALFAAPLAPNSPLVAANANAFGFPGLTDADQFFAGTGPYSNTQFESEPPDQALCAGNGFVVEAVNDAVGIYTSAGIPLIAPTGLNQLFRLAPEISHSGAFGPFIAAPKCYFDRDTGRWILSAFEIDPDPLTGYLYNSTHSTLLIAVSRSADPTGAYGIYTVDTTDAFNSGCPCFGDEPLLGADANAVYITTNEFGIGGTLFNGVQLYAVPKTALAAGTLPAVLHIDVSTLPNPEGYAWSSIQPATAPDTSPASRLRNGTEFFLSALDFSKQGDNRIAVWALTNTQSLRTAFPNVALQHVVVASELYMPPPPATQKPGPAPLAAALRLPLEKIDTSNDRMSQTVFAAGNIWSALTTAVRATTGGISAGLAYFEITPTFDRLGNLAAGMQKQGYVAVPGQNLAYPSVGVNAAGSSVIAATLSGPLYFPSAVYITPDASVHVAGPGAGPDDGFSGYSLFLGEGDYGYYPCCGNDIGRWGPSSAAVADVDGSIWTATEYVSSRRTIWANWGTFIGHIRPAPRPR